MDETTTSASCVQTAPHQSLRELRGLLFGLGRFEAKEPSSFSFHNICHLCCVTLDTYLSGAAGTLLSCPWCYRLFWRPRTFRE